MIETAESTATSFLENIPHPFHFTERTAYWSFLIGFQVQYFLIEFKSIQPYKSNKGQTIAILNEWMNKKNNVTKTYFFQKANSAKKSLKFINFLAREFVYVKYFVNSF